jgi:acyl-CoA synthetase (AMP-forming)/AMP-acid ligase II
MGTVEDHPRPAGLLPSELPDRPALVDAATGVAVTYRDLSASATDWSARLGVSKTLLVLVCRNDRFTIAAYVGAFEGGHAVALLDGQASPAATARVVAAYRPHDVAGPAGLADVLSSNGIPVASVDQLDGGELIRTGYTDAIELHPDLAVLLATSGTTGSRKFVRLSASNVLSNARSIAACLGLTSDECPVTSLPLHYSFGLSVLNSHLRVGATVVVSAGSVLEPSFWSAFREHACTSLAGVPFTFQILERIGFRAMDLPSLRTLQQAGGALDRRLAELYSRHMAERGGRLFVMYGQTEATARIAYVPPGRLPEKLGSAGIAIPDGHLRIEVDEADGDRVPPVGEVVYEGPNVMMGYASGSDDLWRGDDLKGVLRTGDIGYLDDDGFLFLVGRSKRIAKVFGLRVNLDEVELALRQHGPAAVVAGHDAIWGFCEFGTSDSVAALAQTVARDFRIHQSAVRLRRVEAIPTTSAGKIDYQLVERWVPS